MVSKKQGNMHIILLFFGVLFYIYQYALRSAVPSVLNEDLIRHFNTDAEGFGNLLGSFYLAYMIMQIPVGVILDRFSLKKTVVFCLMGLSLCMLCFIKTKCMGIAAISQFLLGVCCSFAFTMVLKITNQFFAREKVAFILSLLLPIGCLGPAIFGPVLSNWCKVYPWESAVTASCSMGLILAILAFFFVNEKKLKSTEGLQYEASTGDGAESITHCAKIIMKNHKIFLYGFFSMLTLGPIMSFTDAWGLTFLKHLYNMDRTSASIATNMVYIGTIIGSPFFACGAARFRSYKKMMMFGASGMTLIFLLIMLVKMDFALLCLALTIFGIFGSCQLLVFPASLSIVEKNISATVSGVTNMLTMLSGVVLVPLVGGIIKFSAELNGEVGVNYSLPDYFNGMWALLISMLLALIITIFIKDEYKQA